MDKTNIINLIEKAFADEAYPGDDNIVTDWWHPENGRIQNLLKGRNWAGLSYDELVYHSASLSFFTTAAFRYFLPAFLIQSLDYSEAGDVDFSLVFALTPNLPNHAQFRERIDSLSRAECEAIKEVFQYIEKTYPFELDESTLASAVQYWSSEVQKG